MSLQTLESWHRRAAVSSNPQPLTIAVEYTLQANGAVQWKVTLRGKSQVGIHPSMTLAQRATNEFISASL